MKYFALTEPGIDLKNAKGIIRVLDNSIPEKYDINSNTWEKSAELLQIFTGGIEVTMVSETEAYAILERVKVS